MPASQRHPWIPPVPQSHKKTHQAVIKSTEQGIRLADGEGGEERRLDMETLREQLAEAFRECGIEDAWIPDNLLDVLEKRLREDEGEVAGQLESSDVYDMLAETLSSTGFGDVARTFSRLHGSDLPATSEPLRRREWSADELCELLAEEGPSWRPRDEEALKRLSAEAAKAIARLGMSGGVSSALALEVARNILAAKGETAAAGTARAASAELAPPAPASSTPPPSLQSQVRPGFQTQYIAADQWALECSPQVQELMRLRIIRLCPASDILPVAAVECNLSRIFDLPEPPRHEEELLALVTQLCRTIRGLLEQMHRRMSQCWPSLGQPSSSRVRFNHYESFLRIACRSGRRRELSALRSHLAEVLTAQLPDDGLSLCYT